MDVGSGVGVLMGVGGWKKGGLWWEYWVLIQRIIENIKVVKSRNKPHFVTAILAIEFVFLVYFFVGGS